MSREITESGLREILFDHPWRDRITVLDRVESTNTALMAQCRSGAPGGTVLIARSQTGGRGRQGKAFASEPGGLYLSVLFRPDCTFSRLGPVTAMAAVALCDAVEEAACLRPEIKWVNDLILGGKKLAGILTELDFTPGTDRISGLVLGVGLNAGQRDFSPELQAIAGSLRQITGKEPDLHTLAAAVIRHLSALEPVLTGGYEPMLEKYRRDCLTLGKQIQVIRAAGRRQAEALSLTDSAELLVEYPDGTRETLSSGEVSVRGMYDYV